MISEQAITIISVLSSDIQDAIGITEDQTTTVYDMLMDTVGIKLTEHSAYIDSISGEQDYDYETAYK